MAAAAPEYEEFNAKAETVSGKDYDTIIVDVPDFKKGQLRVQLTSTNLIRVSGEREAKAGKIPRFRKEFPLDPNVVDVNQISAKFEKDKLHVKLPKKADQQQEPAKTANSESNLGKESDQASDQTKLSDDAGKANENDQVAAPATTTMATSEISRRSSRKALYAVLVGLVAVAVAVGVGLYFTNVEKYQT